MEALSAMSSPQGFCRWALTQRRKDHPDYGDFEGTIPKGRYGGGTLMLWDRGYWEPEGTKGPEQVLAKGDFKFNLEGERLQAVLSWSAWPTIGNGTSAQTGS
jgi:DNA ligase D-like protein (predicted 3'-phosphoesterase)